MDDVRAERDEAVKLRAIMSVLRAALDQAEREGGIEHG
jgi:hypothetical protein